MKKTIFFTLFLWAVAITGYAQSFSVPKPKGLQCGDMPSWPIAHSKKNNAAPATGSSKNAGGSVNARPVTSLPLIPMIKLWLISEPAAGSKDDE
jgi:hypothetical protein